MITVDERARRADALEARARAALSDSSLAETLSVLAALDPNGTWRPGDCAADGVPVPTLAEARASLAQMLDQ